MTSDRRYDIVLLGATGFAGRLTAAYLAAHAPHDARIALAGRNPDTVAEVAASLDTPVVVDTVRADVTDETSLRELAALTRVLATTVGPYVLHGDAVVAACAAAGTDYLDLTGEPEFVNRCYVRHHATAQRSGARLVHAAGFDSVPHDLGVLFTVEQLPPDVPIRVSGYVRAKAGFSGGTFSSAVTAFSRPRQNAAAARERRRLEVRPTDRSARSVPGHPHRDPVDGGWAVPLPTLDPQVVARSARALDRYGPDFTYSHFAAVPHLRTAAAGVVGVSALFGLAQIPPVRTALLNRQPPGAGPSAEQRAKSWFTVTFVGTGGGRRVVTRVSGGDPGYDETARMLGESALCLAFDDVPDTSGQVTTATAMGDALIARLRDSGMRFEVLSDSPHP